VSQQNFDNRQIIDEIRNRIDIVELISETVSLKKAGSSYKGLCPFHSEKTPSFNVNRERGLYKCFGCGKSGDIFSFLEETQGMTFVEALRELAKLAGVSLPSWKSSDGGKREAILALNESAQKFFSDNLLSKNGNEARAYLGKRGINAEMIEKFGLGLAPTGWDVFYRKAGKSMAPENLKVSGLFREREGGGWYDLFRDRIIFPIQDIHGNIIAFGGREYLEEKGPKYINSPETPVYTKGKTLYAMNLAKEKIKRLSCAVLVEGYTDVILCHKYGFSQVVASLGTALTSDQVALISRLASKVILAYDADSAGQAAAERGIDIVLMRGLDVRVALFEEKDPADLLLSGDESRFVASLDKAEEFIEHRINRLLESAKNPQERAVAAKNLLSSLSSITDSILRSSLIKRIAERFGVSEDALITASNLDSRPIIEKAEIQKIVRGMDTELSLLKLMLEDPELREVGARELRPEDFSKEVRRNVFSAIIEAGRNGESMIGDLGGRVQGIGIDLLAHISNSELPTGDTKKLFSDFTKIVKLQKIDAEINDCTVNLQKESLTINEKVMLTKQLTGLLKEKSLVVNSKKVGEHPV